MTREALARRASRMAALAALAAAGWPANAPAAGRRIRSLSVRPLPQVECERDRIADTVSFGAEAPAGYLAAGLEWQESAPETLFFSIETASGVYRDSSPLPSTAKIWGAELRAVVDSGALIVGFLWRHGGDDPATWRCAYGAAVCRLLDGSVPSCAPAQMTKRDEKCPDGTAAAAWMQSGAAGGRALLFGKPVAWNDALSRPLSGPLRDHDTRSWRRIGQLRFSTYHGVRAVELASTEDERHRRIEIATSLGCFSDGRQATPPPVGTGTKTRRTGDDARVGAVLDSQSMGKILLVTWSWGVGRIDPPESTYVPCRQAFMACVLDHAGRPLCAEPVTVAKARVCRSNVDANELAWKVPPARLLPDGDTFQLQDQLYRIVVPRP